MWLYSVVVKIQGHLEQKAFPFGKLFVKAKQSSKYPSPATRNLAMDLLEGLSYKDKKPYTLAFIMKDKEVLLGLKKYGFGKDKWNGFGGKPLKGELIKDAAVREIGEECGLIVQPADLTQCGIIHFEFVGNPTLMKVHVFKCDKFEGEPVESEEMLPKWFPLDNVPHDKMWVDDEIWYPLLLQGQKFRAYFLLDGFSTILKYVIVEFDKPSVVLKSEGY